ncbi:amino acid ABC transporter permease [Variovorax sp. SRS16]|uniref:amino acid ABC transporter permease n=1 Tax=Variovorax sp. SRS16 TaxID=282217 RepID=UPI0013A57DFE|nr:amino acid ABC transporter permease [Variovorax sp. SRS16]
MSYQMDWEAVLPHLPSMMKGVVFTLQISFTGFALSLLFGLAIALMRMSSLKAVSAFAFGYTQFFRAISIYIYIIWIYFGLAVSTGINLSPYVASVIAITLLHSAYLSEIFRATINSVGGGQLEAARSLGMKRGAVFYDVVMPQALATAVPLLISQFAMIVKDSAVVAVIGASDLMYETIRAANLELRSFEFYSVAAVIYLAIVLVVSWIGNVLEYQLNKHMRQSA